VVDTYRGWTFPVMTGKDYNLHFSIGKELKSIALNNNYYWENGQRVNLHFNMTSTPELFDVFYTGIDESTYVTSKLLEKSENFNTLGNMVAYTYDKDLKNLVFNINGNQVGEVKAVKIFCRF
jgi:hypothetical protein